MLRILQKRLLAMPRPQRCQLFSSSASPVDSSQDDGSDMRREAGMNRVQLLGRVGRDPEIRGSPDRPLCVFPLATHHSFTKADGERVNRTDWHRITVFKPVLRDYVVPRIGKGDRLYAEGMLTYSSYTDDKGTTINITSVNADKLILLAKRKAAETDGGGDEL